MPSKAGRVCGHCSQVHQPAERCPLTKAMDDERKARFDKTRPSARQRGYDGKWQKESKAFLAMPNNRLCACGCGRPSNMVDHKVRHQGDQRLFWDRANWQAMNSHCHNTKKQSAEKRQARTGGASMNFSDFIGTGGGRFARDLPEIGFSHHRKDFDR